MKKRVLFVGLHNGGRCQMAEAFLKRLCGYGFDVHSAGLDPRDLNPLVIEVMREIGIDMSGHRAKWLFDFIQSGQKFDYVITVCDDANANRCPQFVDGKRLHWTFPDLANLHGTSEENLAEARAIRDLIQATLVNWCKQVCPEPPLVRPENPLFPGHSPLNP